MCVEGIMEKIQRLLIKLPGGQNFSKARVRAFSAITILLENPLTIGRHLESGLPGSWTSKSLQNRLRRCPSERNVFDIIL